MIKGYIGVSSESSYAAEDGITWFVTGGQVVMDKEHTIGKYKDLVFLGEENTSAAAVEICLGKVQGVTVSHLHFSPFTSSSLDGGSLCSAYIPVLDLD